ncbi:MAG TPA: CoA transferase [Candidatus Limnocylindrales bacterium]|nr:CoA transferase [Candidatus Limnocylindrales bacterium]
MPPDTPSGPLAGIVVADLSTVLAGPYATMLLGDLGADVVKVEPPDGDPTRRWGPPWVGEGSNRTAAYYLSVNRNKRSIVLDLHDPGAKDVLARLLARADVLVENARTDGLARLGFDDERLRTLNPELIHLAITGYGTSGPDADRSGYDFVVQAESGLMSITGFADGDGGRPTKVGVAIADVVTGLHAAVAILAGLVGRTRTRRGGQRIDVSLLGATLSALVNQAQNAWIGGDSPERLGNAHPNIVPYETFATADGDVAVAVGSERQWRRFCEAVELSALAGDARFATNGERVANRGVLRPILADRLAARSTAEWLVRLRAADVPVGAIHDVAAAFESPAADALGAVRSMRHAVLGEIRQVAPAATFEATPATLRRPPPLAGEQRDEILAELGYDPAEAEALRARGVP